MCAQHFATLHNFSTNSTDASSSFGGLVLSGNTLYGTGGGGSAGGGTAFALDITGSGLTILHNFASTGCCPYTNSGGAAPFSRPVLAGKTLFGTTQQGGSGAAGVLFAIDVIGRNLTSLYDFSERTGSILTNFDGAHPGNLVLQGDTLYGTAFCGGAWNNGTIFTIKTNGLGFTVLHTFSAKTNNTNSDGVGPGKLILAGDTLYGTTGNGGSGGSGVVFSMNTNGSDFVTLHNFAPLSSCTNCWDNAPTNSDGLGPAKLILSDHVLYGIANGGGIWGKGTIFKLNTDGSGFTNLHNFTRFDSGGIYPRDLVLSGNSLYGTASFGGIGNGTVFKINSDGTEFTVLYSFNRVSSYPSFTNYDGANPFGEMVLSGNTLYGTTTAGGASGRGTVFSLSFAPHLTITRSDLKVILTWPTNFAGFDYTGFILQSTTNFLSPVWATVSPAPIVVNGQNSVTNPSSEAQKCYRLSQEPLSARMATD